MCPASSEEWDRIGQRQLLGSIFTGAVYTVVTAQLMENNYVTARLPEYGKTGHCVSAEQH